MDVELSEDKWVMSIPIAPNYTVQEAALVLSLTTTWIRVCEALHGPASTDGRPVDHDALVRFVLIRARRRKRVVARAQLKRLLEQHLGD